jgi:hypothetical protein
MFLTRSPQPTYRWDMPNAPTLSPDEISRLIPVDPDDIRQSIAHGLRYDGRKRMRHADDSMAAIAADHLVKFLEARGYVVLKRPPSPTDWISAHSTIPMTE